MVDQSGEAVAKSSRPLFMPYQSPTSRFLEALALQPFRILGLVERVESATIHAQLMNDYEEPAAHQPHTEYMELSLALGSPTQMDVLDAHITVLPRVKGVV
eukprot:gene21595-27633_t